MIDKKIEFRPLQNDSYRTRVKICGLTTLEDARFVSGALADYIGFIFHRDSPRYIEPETAAEIISWIEGPESVGVFVDYPADDVNEVIAKTGIHYVQLHGSESPEYCAIMDRPVIRAFRVKPGMTASDLVEMIRPYENVVDFFLFDAFDETRHGGTGKQFDWNTVREISGDYPIFIAGGIGTMNLRRAIKLVEPYAVDVSSSLEIQPGIKDFDKLNDFFDELRSIWDEQETGTF
jgi:phosphoribosylanthranilate isomerase